MPQLKSGISGPGCATGTNGINPTLERFGRKSLNVHIKPTGRRPSGVVADKDAQVIAESDDPATVLNDDPIVFQRVRLFKKHGRRLNAGAIEARTF
jgi:hypothetical protein